MVKTDRHWWSSLPFFSTPMRPIYLLALISLLALVGCRKDRSHTTAEGVVIDATTQARVPHALVYLLQTQGTSLYASPSRIQRVQADELGRYSLSFEAADDSQYDLQAVAPTFFDTPSNEYVGLRKGEKNQQNVPLRPEAWLNVRFLSAASGILTGVSLQSPNEAAADVSGKDVDTTIFSRCQGNTVIELVWWIINNRNSASIYCPAHDTTDYTIRF